MKSGAWTNSDMKNSIVIFLILFGTENSVFGQILSKKSKLCTFYHVVWRLRNKKTCKKTNKKKCLKVSNIKMISQVFVIRCIYEKYLKQFI